MRYVDLWIPSLENQTNETLNTVAPRTLSYIEDCYSHPVRMTTTVRTKSSLMCRTINFSLICCHYIPCVLILVIARRLFKKCEKNFIKNMYKCQSEKTADMYHRVSDASPVAVELMNLNLVSEINPSNCQLKFCFAQRLHTWILYTLYSRSMHSYWSTLLRTLLPLLSLVPCLLSPTLSFVLPLPSGWAFAPVATFSVSIGSGGAGADMSM